MKTIIALLFVSLFAFGQDTTPITVEVRNSARLEWGGAPVKQKAVVLYYCPVYEGKKDFLIRVSIQMYANVGGAYGAKITTLIGADTTLTWEEQVDLLDRYRDREVAYTPAGKYVDASGDHVTAETPGAVPELQYWQSFKLNHASLNMTSANTQGALDAEYKIVTAIILKLNSRKNF